METVCISAITLVLGIAFGYILMEIIRRRP